MCWIWTGILERRGALARVLTVRLGCGRKKWVLVILVLRAWDMHWVYVYDRIEIFFRLD